MLPKSLATLPRRVLARLARETQRAVGRWRDTRRSTYVTVPVALGEPLFAPLSIDVLAPRAASLRDAAARAARGEFQIFELTLTNTRHGASCVGWRGRQAPVFPTLVADQAGAWLKKCVTPRNLGEAQRRWRLIGGPRSPIDWQCDFRSGHRWSERQWHGDIRHGQAPGVDIKVPWELGRLHHLPWFALAHGLDGDTAGASDAFRQHLLDFTASNPPGFGVQWACPMDVAIRIVNIIAALDLFLGFGARYDDDLLTVAGSMIWEHADHVCRHLENRGEVRGNHFFANLVGLLFAAARLAPTPRVDHWLSFAARELLVEIDRQFLPDGGNFEASTCYHRLTIEMALFGLALLEGLRSAGDARAPAIPDSLKTRLCHAVGFTAALAEGGNAPQIGDNDSGRLLMLRQSEDDLDHRGVLGFAAGLLTSPTPVDERFALERAIVTGLARRPTPAWPAWRSSDSFPQFGLYILRAGRFRVIVRAGAVGQLGVGGHAHNDQLSITLDVDQCPVVVDSGTYVYTPDPEWRNRFRATAAHNTLMVDGREQNVWPAGQRGLFRLTDRARGEALEHSSTHFVGRHHGFGAPHERRLILSEHRLDGHDCHGGDAAVARFHLAPSVSAEPTADGVRVTLPNGQRLRFVGGMGAWSVADAVVSPRYGAIAPTRVIMLTLAGRRAEWSIFWENDDGPNERASAG